MAKHQVLAPIFFFGDFTNNYIMLFKIIVTNSPNGLLVVNYLFNFKRMIIRLHFLKGNWDSMFMNNDYNEK